MPGRMSKLRVGIVGSGFGATVHLPSFRAHERFEVVAIASPRRAAEIAKQRNVAHAFDSCAAMLDGVEVDVVSVSSPPFQHHDDVLAALEGGKHVLCEKPFALNVKQSEAMLAASQRAGTICALAFEFRYLPSRIAIRELVANAHLGALRQIEIELMGTNLRADAERPNSWWFEKRCGGGVANGYMPHLFDQARWLAGRDPVSVTGLLRTANKQRHSGKDTFTSDVADGAFAIVDFGDGLIATIAADMTHATQSSLLAIHGEQRTVVASGGTIHEPTTFLVDEEETAELELRPDPRAHLSAAHPSIPAFTALLDDFANAIDGKPNAIPTFADGAAAQRCLEAIGYTSS